jgi:hypothetical protein
VFYYQLPALWQWHLLAGFFICKKTSKKSVIYQKNRLTSDNGHDILYIASPTTDITKETVHMANIKYSPEIQVELRECVGEMLIRVYEGRACGSYDLQGNRKYWDNVNVEQNERWLVEVRKFMEKIEQYKDLMTQTFYIRFNDLPKNRRSKNHATGQFEKGVSCYRATFDVNTETFKFVEDGTDAGAAIAYVFEQAPVYLLTGEQVGKGSDGEPVLKNVSIVSKLAYDVDRDGYVKKA